MLSSTHILTVKGKGKVAEIEIKGALLQEKLQEMRKLLYTVENIIIDGIGHYVKGKSSTEKIHLIYELARQSVVQRL
jgi:hypothetical protein